MGMVAQQGPSTTDPKVGPPSAGMEEQMSQKTSTGPLILGAGGQVGQMLYRLWVAGSLTFDGDPMWHLRRPRPSQKQTLCWDLLQDVAPPIKPNAVICFAGGKNVKSNVALAEAALNIADGAPLLYASTQAVYGRQEGSMSEASPCQPDNDYAVQKYATERAMAEAPNVVCLRVGNVIGADTLLAAVRSGPVALDQFEDGQSPRRMMIGPQTLGQILIDLIAKFDVLEPILNLSQPGLIEMSDLLDAAGASWFWQPAPKTALPSLEMDLTTLQSHVTVPPADPAQLVREARAAGWRDAP